MQNLPKLAISGYGKMGKEIEFFAKQQNFIITDIFDIDNIPSIDKEYFFDVVIDFTQPDVVLNNINTFIKLKKNIVIGTTGWFDNINIVGEAINKNNLGLVYSSNFSLGMQMFFKIIQYASKLFANIDDYDIAINEIHHIHKKDSPSGTALKLAELIIKESKIKNTINRGDSYCVDKSELNITSSRCGEITGIHTVFFDSLSDTLELSHKAKNRSGLALGALLSAKWIYNKTGIYEFSQILDEIL